MVDTSGLTTLVDLDNKAYQSFIEIIFDQCQSHVHASIVQAEEGGGPGLEHGTYVQAVGHLKMGDVGDRVITGYFGPLPKAQKIAYVGIEDPTPKPTPANPHPKKPKAKEITPSVHPQEPGSAKDETAKKKFMTYVVDNKIGDAVINLANERGIKGNFPATVEILNQLLRLAVGRNIERNAVFGIAPSQIKANEELLTFAGDWHYENVHYALSQAGDTYNIFLDLINQETKAN